MLWLVAHNPFKEPCSLVCFMPCWDQMYPKLEITLGIGRWLHCFLAHIRFCLRETAATAQQKITFVLRQRATTETWAAARYLGSCTSKHCLCCLPQTNNLDYKHVVQSQSWPYGPCMQQARRRISHYIEYAVTCIIGHNWVLLECFKPGRSSKLFGCNYTYSESCW